MISPPVIAITVQVGLYLSRPSDAGRSSRFALGSATTRKGFPNAVWHGTVCDQGGFNAPGGCTDERTMERPNADAFKLAELQSVVREDGREELRGIRAAH